MDQTKLAQLTAALMDVIEGDFPEATGLGDVILIAEVRVGEQSSILNMSTTGGRSHHALGMLEHVRQTYLPRS